MIEIPASTLINKPGRPRKQLYAIFTKAVSDYERMQEYRPAHLDYLHNLDDKGDLVGAGPILNHDASLYEGGGLIIITASSLSQALEMAAGDPFHQYGVREYVVHPWLLSEGQMVSDLA